MRWLLVLLLVGSCGKKPPPTCDEVTAHIDPMYAAMDRFDRTDHLMHALAIGRRKCPNLTDDQRRCLIKTKNFDDTYACLGKVAPHAEKKDIFALLTAEHEPLLVGPFRDIPWKPEARVDWISPKYCAHEAIVPAWCEYKTDEFPGAVFRFFRERSDDDKNPPIGPFRVTVPGAGVRDKLIAAWGQPRDVGDTAYWFNPRMHMRVGLHTPRMQGDPPDHVDIELSGYQTLDEVLGDGSLFSFEGGKPLVGASEAQVRERFKARVGGGAITLWPLETAEKPLLVQIGSDLDTSLPERVDGFHFSLRSAPTKQIEAALAKKFGAPREDGSELVYRDKPRVALDDDTVYVGEQ